MSPFRFLFLSLVSIVLGFTTIVANDLASGVTIGDKAPDFRLMNVDSQMVSLSSFKGAKGIILVFTCNACPFAKAYEDRIIALHKKFYSEGWPVLAINPNDPVIEPEDSFENMQIRAKEKEYPFAYAFDSTQNTAKAYGARRTPHVYLLTNTKTGFVVDYIGAIDDSPRDAEAVKARFVEDAINALNNGKAPSVTTTKAIGCAIKWRES